MAGISSLIVLIVICKNDISASYFTYKDIYWTLLYEKPWSRILCYLVGVVFGCTYYSFKHEQNRNESEDEAEEDLGLQEE